MTMTKTNGMMVDTSIEVTNKAIENENKVATTEREEVDEEDEITLEDRAPDGGWGWMIAFAMILTFVSINNKYKSVSFKTLFLKQPVNMSERN